MPLAMLFVVLLGGCRADQQRCEQAARNYATLTYWKKADAEIAALPADKRQSARKKRLAQFTHEVDDHIDDIVRQCQSANNDDQIECMINAKTADEVSDCADLLKKD